ncbi:MAG: hypothetical protein KA766_11810 [Piscinibacter sp.]|uniref:hypothetical protein n=1 Tax=Piscinibacter sp. TaxID=1903157 RepID=UPI001B7BE6F9|nr:hypothetical protein [Piscinibacter sp.]MBP5990681.1 hypothetical protein [Piscinibacter sp.]
MTPDEYGEKCRAVREAPASGLRAALDSLATGHQEAVSRFAPAPGGAAAIFDVWKASFEVRRGTPEAKRPHTGIVETKAWILALAEDWYAVRSGLPDGNPLKHERVFDYVFLREAPELLEAMQCALPAEVAWHAEVRRWVLPALANPGIPDKPSTNYADLLGLVDLLNAVVGPSAANSPVTQGEGVMERQIEQFFLAERCQANHLLRAVEVDATVPDAVSEAVALDVFRLLALLRWEAGGEERDWRDLLVSPTGKEAARTRANLLKHWAATIPLFEVFLAETGGFRFDEGPTTWQAADYQPMSGGDVPVSIIGARDAGKSSFLFAQDAHAVVQLRAIDRTEVPRLNELQAIWKRGGPRSEEERAVWKTGGDTALTAWSRTDGEMFKLFIRDLPGEHLEGLVLQPDSQESTAMKEHLGRNAPAATLFIYGKPASQALLEGTNFRAGHVLGTYWGLLPKSRDGVPVLVLRNFLDERVRELTGGEGGQEQVRGLIDMTQRVALEKGGWWADPSARLRRRSHYEVPAFRRVLHEDLGEVDQLRKDARLPEKLPFGFFYVCASGKVDGDYRASCRGLWQELTGSLRRLSAKGRSRLLSQEIDRLKRIAESLDKPLKTFNVDPSKEVLASLCNAANGDDDGVLVDEDRQRLVAWESGKDKIASLAGVRPIEKAADDLCQALADLETHLGQLATEVLWGMGIPSNLTLVRDITPQTLALQPPLVRDRLARAKGLLEVDGRFGVLSTRCPVKDEEVSTHLLEELFDVAQEAQVDKILKDLMGKKAPLGAAGEYGANLADWPKDDPGEPLTALRLLQGFRHSLLPGDPNGSYDAMRPPDEGLGLATRINLRHFYLHRSQIPTPALGAVQEAKNSIRECEFRGALLVLSALGICRTIGDYRNRVDRLRDRLVGDYNFRLIKAYAPTAADPVVIVKKNNEFLTATVEGGLIERAKDYLKSKKAEMAAHLTAYQAIGRLEEFEGHEEERRNEAMAFNRFHAAALQRGKLEPYTLAEGDLNLFPPMGRLAQCWDNFRRATAIAVHDVAWSYFVRASGWLALREHAADVRTVEPVMRLQALTTQVAEARKRIQELTPEPEA